MDIRNKKGKLITEEELRDEALDMLVDVLSDLSEESQLEVSNQYRNYNNDPELQENEEDNLNDALSGLDPYELLQLGNDDWDEYADYFSYSRYEGFETTDDVWEGAEMRDVAEAILDEDINPSLSELTDIRDEYTDAIEQLENYNPYRKEGEELLKRYVNCKADVNDLLQYIDRLVKNDDVWAEQ